jgi:predicted nucleic acid-binding protein
MRLALDTNVLVYAAGVNGSDAKKTALALIGRLPEPDTFLPIQALGELFRVLVRKASFTPDQARVTIVRWRDTFPLIEASPSVFQAAVDLAVDHRLNIWDAVILAAASEAGCRLLLSEDLQDGFTWSGVTVANPFAKKKHALLVALLED